MAKLTLSPITNPQNETTLTGTINTNNTNTVTALENTLSRDGSTPNQMNAQLDMNSNRIINLPVPVGNNEPVTLSMFNAASLGSGNMPTGGNTNQVLAKASTDHYDTVWEDVSSAVLAGTNITVSGTSPVTISTSNSPTLTSGVFNGSTSGSTTVMAAAVASGTVTLPAATDTLVGKATTDTLTNKTLTSPVINTPTGIVKSDVGLGNVDNTSDATKNAAVATLTNKSIDASQLTGTVVAGRMPALSGDVSTSAGSTTTAIGANKVTNAMRSTMAAYTLKGNATASTANEADIDVTALTLKASPVSGDIVLIQDSAAGNAFKKATVGTLASGGTVSSVNGATGNVPLYFHPSGRLTLVTGVPVMVSSQAAATTIYYTPYAGNMVPIYDGTYMVPTAVAEVSQTTTDTTKSPAACAASTNYDMFVWNDGGTVRCTRGPTWNAGAVAGSDTARGTGAASTELQLINGIYTNKNAISNGPAANRGTYVGTIRTNSSSSVDYIVAPAAGSFGVAAVLNVWNAYNRVTVSTTTRDNTGTWPYSTLTTWRVANGSTTNYVEMVRGLNEDAIQCVYWAGGNAGASTVMNAGVGVNSTTAFSGKTGLSNSVSTADITASYVGCPGLGYNRVYPIEYNSTTTASTWYGNLGGTNYQSSFAVTLRA